jgi:hypothetical protein
LQRQHARIAEVAPAYEKGEPVVEERPPLSPELFQFLINNSEVIHARLDVLCRFVLVYRGIAKESGNAVAAELRISPIAVERAYNVAFDALNLVQRGEVIGRTMQPCGHIYHESVLSASID